LEEKRMTPKILFTDLDGTITDDQSTIPPTISEALARLGERKVVRIVATGRSLHSARRVIAPDFPIDYLIFSCGSGIVEWKTGDVVNAHHLQSDEIERVTQHLLLQGLDFMLHRAIPDNHCFYYFSSGQENPDFARRCERNADFAISSRLSFPVLREATQFLVVEPPARGATVFERLKTELSPLSVIRTTSPLDHSSMWVEIFAPGVSKARGASWLAERLGFEPQEAVAIGNDYNDIELLEWAHHKYLVSNAPPDLQARYRTLSGRGPAGFLEMVQQFK
jgi:Cof subfamily protein (haloacid dehalogenase superfamily)